MHVAFVLFRYFPFGGMQRDMLTTAQMCLARGHQVTILCHTWQGEQPAGITIEVLAVSGTANHARAKRLDQALQKRFGNQRPDVVIGFDKVSGLDLYFAADPCFVTRTAHRPWPYRLLPRYHTFRDLEGAVFGPASPTRILLLDSRERSSYQASWQTPDDRFEELPPGIARNRCRGSDAAALRAAARQELGIAPQQRLLLLLAANFQLKGLDRTLRAAAALPDELRQRIHLLAVGEGPSKAWQQLAKQLGMQAQTTLLTGRDDVPRLLQAADLLVHPARRDTTGTVLLEALVAGLPVLCSAACGYAQHIQSARCGLVLPEPFQQTALNDGLQQLLSKDLSRLQAAALAYAGEHDLHSMHRVIVQAIESVQVPLGATHKP